MAQQGTQQKGGNSSATLMEKLVSLCKRRGFVFQSSEIYGGLNGAWDYGPLGVELLRNLKAEWWKEMTYRENIEGIDAAILMHPRVWEASGHVENFTDPMVDCKQCKSRYRLDILLEGYSEKNRRKIAEELANFINTNSENPNLFKGFLDELISVDPRFASTLSTKEIVDILLDLSKQIDWMVEKFSTLLFKKEFSKIALPFLLCPNCGNKGTFTEARKFNLMFKTYVGPVEDTGAVVYLRPETAQGIFVNFLNVQAGSRQKVPFGIAQIGKAFRNEINTKNFLFRTREFEQMEMQFFVKPGTDVEWFEYWRAQRMQWFINLGMAKEKLQWHQHPPDKLAHYAKDAYDIEYAFPFGWGEIEGVHNRTDFDLSRHEQFSGKSLKYFDETTKEKYTPYIIETSAGASRSFMAFLVNAYAEEEAPTGEGGVETRVVLRFHPKLAPVKAAIFPLVNRDGMPEISKKIEADLRPHFRVFYDDSGAVGRRYRRQDEAGTPFCITVDSQTLQDQTVTIRERDSMKQERIAAEAIAKYVGERI
ncbi:MAG TPA: glycine--tRNA ligase [Bacteroidota bacterium]|nr:glycine--tRNA ligase [Bacteroidota bacterium]